MSGKEYPNNYDFVLASDFTDVEYDEFMQEMSSWIIPSSHCCIMRIENKDTGKIIEKSYRTMKGATNKLVQLVDDPANVITLVDDVSIHLLKYPDDYDSTESDPDAD